MSGVTDFAGLSNEARRVWGKTSRNGFDWLPLPQHLADSADVAERLWHHWLPDAVRRRIAAELPDGDKDGCRLVCWLTGVHDIGKATPAFACQVPSLARRMKDSGFTFDEKVTHYRRLAPHALAGHVILRDWLSQQDGWTEDQAAQFAVVVGSHHGVPPSHSEINQLLANPYLIGDGVWERVRNELLDWMADRTGVRDRLADWRHVTLSQPVQVLLSAIVIVADWIASNQDLFPCGIRDEEAMDRLEQAWELLELPRPWRPVDTSTLPVSTLFSTRFALPAGAEPYPVQAAVVAQAQQMPTPGMLIVEAPMGEGKTEAALAAVEILAARTGAGGCFIALPTRATSDAMFSRVVRWMRRLPDVDPHRGFLDANLAHGKAWLNEEFSQLYRGKLPSGIGADEAGADIAVHRWLAGRKKTLLSNFVIGTIDQLLFTALKSRHVMLRHLGLAGKIVVIDEAHAYDVYMSHYLDRALEWLGAHHVPVVVLSATLPAQRRAEMMKAYDDGRLGRAKPSADPSREKRWQRQVEGRKPADTYEPLRKDQRYPLLSVSGADRNPTVVGCAPSGRRVTVRLSQQDDDPHGLAAVLRRELADGGCALVIRNTVSRVLETAAVLRQALGPEIPVAVAHSRFMAADRAAKDRWLLDTFGPSSGDEANQRRPDRYVVVASQVAEQSLDIDFDLLVTDLAPVDLILQRLGRLHRHERPHRPARLSRPRCLITGAEWGSDPIKPDPGSVRVYDRYALLRAAAVLLPYLTGERELELPGDIAPLVQAAYGDGQLGPASWRAALDEATTEQKERRQEAKRRADDYRMGTVGAPGEPIIAWLYAGIGDVDTGGDERRGRAHVRDDSAEELEVLLVVRHGDQFIVPPWLSDHRYAGTPVPTDFEPEPSLARTLLRCALPLPRTMTANGGIDRIIKELEVRNRFPAWDRCHWLKGELVLDLDEHGRAQLTDFALEYDPHDGLRVTRRNADT